MDSFDLYLIGGKFVGESFILHVPSTGFCMIFDVCKESELATNLTLDCLDELGIETVDYFFWTHPDKDHYLGIDELLDEKKVKWFVTPKADHLEKDTLMYLGLAKVPALDQIMTKLFALQKSSGLKRKFVGQDTGFYLDGLADFFGGKCFIKFFAPVDQVIAKNRAAQMQTARDFVAFGTKIKEVSANDYSLGAILEIGRKKVFLFGDVEDKSLKSLDKDFLEAEFSEMDYVKIPHHGSSSTQYHFSFVKRIHVAVTSKFRSVAPSVEVLKQYKAHTNEVYQTGCLTSHTFGRIVSNVQLGGNIVTRCEGNAGVFVS